jgi:aryl-alcohol dehydrogenase-like predicted oxidoreductase
LADRKYEDVISYCERGKIGFIPWNPINAGNLGPLDTKLKEVANRHGVTTAQLALAWLLWRSPVMLPIPGTSQVTHLEENVAAASIEVNGKELQRLNRTA